MTEILLIIAAVFILISVLCEYIVNLNFNNQVDSIRQGDNYSAYEYEKAWHKYNEYSMVSIFMTLLSILTLLGVSAFLIIGISGVMWVISMTYMHANRKGGRFDEMTFWEKAYEFGDGRGNMIENTATLFNKGINFPLKLIGVKLSYKLTSLIMKLILIAMFTYIGFGGGESFIENMKPLSKVVESVLNK